MDARKTEIEAKLAAVRARTLGLLDLVPDDFWQRRVHGFYSPIGWHFGHVGRTEEFWACHRALAWPVADDRLTFLFHDCPENPRDNRVNIPDRAGCVAYLERTRASALRALQEADLDSSTPLIRNGYAWEFAHQHECQHQETILEMLCLIHQEIGSKAPPPDRCPVRSGGGVGEGESGAPPLDRCLVRSGGGVGEGAHAAGHAPFTVIAAQTFRMGTDNPFAYDNEQGAHEARVEPFEVATRPVTVGEWRAFVTGHGYQDARLWTPAGWDWREAEAIERPEYWSECGSFAYGIRGPRPLAEDEPVQGVSWFEADAFARWAGARLPTETEWESLWGPDRWPWGDEPPTPETASLRPESESPTNPIRGHSRHGVQGLAGGVWEWTSTPFAPYPGFRAHPYDGYSKDHMDGRHFVCRGGSWATSATIARRTFRNWYVPSYRQGFLGVRLARG